MITNRLNPIAFCVTMIERNRLHHINELTVVSPMVETGVKKMLPHEYLEWTLTVRRTEITPEIRAIIEEVRTSYEQRHQLPPMATMAKNVLGSAFRAGAAAIKGKRVYATPEETSRRMAICRKNECGAFIVVKDHERCRLCGCFVNLKAQLETDKCPVGKW